MTNSLSSDYPHGFAHGVNIQNIPIEISISDRANVFWVDSTIGYDLSGYGTRKRPFATIDYAIGKCNADHGDIIYVAQKHAETVITAGGITCDIAGITIIFLGEGSDRGTVTFSTLTTASMVISANNVTIINPRFVSGIDALAAPISITGTYCRIYNGEWNDAPAKAVTNCIVATNAATGLVIDGYTFYASTTGTQKATHIKIADIASPVLRNLDIRGDFSTAPVNITAAATNVVFQNWKIQNTNATPKPGLDQHANTTGFAKNLDIRVASGTTYVSSVAKINWDDMCLGYNTDGQGGDPIAGATSGSIEAKIDAIQADIGDPSARTNFKSIETMIGIPDAANSNVDDMLRTGFDSTAIVANANGSIMERLEFVQNNIPTSDNILSHLGNCDAGMAGSTTTIVAADLAGFGNDYFNTKYYMQVIRNDNAHGVAPETQIRQITGYVSATGTFTTNAFGANVEAADIIAVIHESLIAGTTAAGTIVNTLNTNVGSAVGDTLPSVNAKLGNGATTVAADLTTVKAAVAKIDGATVAVSPTAGSLAAFLASGGTALGTQLGDSKSIIDALGTNGVAAAAATCASAVSLFGAIGTNEADATTPFASNNVQANADGTVLEREEYIQTQVNKIDGVTLAAAPTAGSLAQFIASGGVGLGTALANSKSLVDAIGSNGSTLAYGAGSALGAIGTEFLIKKTVTSSDILQVSNVDITGVSSGGELAIEDVIVKTDGTGLATGTNFELLSNNAKGLANIFVETVANLGANKTVDLSTASVTKIRTVLESGAKLQVHSTVAACTGAGTIDIYVKFKRLSAGATIAAL